MSGLTHLIRRALVNDLQITVPMHDAIAKGGISGVMSWTKTGRNGDVDVGKEDLWTQGGTYVFPTTAQQLRVVSTSAQDGPGGTGATEVYVDYLDDKFEEHREFITMNGLAPVSTVATDIYRIQHFRVSATGTGLKADGVINIYSLGGATPIYSQILADCSRARTCVWTVPVGKTLYIHHVGFTCGGITKANANVAVFKTGATYDNVLEERLDFFMAYTEKVVENTSLIIELSVPTKLPEKVDLRVVAEGLTIDNVCACQLRGYLIED